MSAEQDFYADVIETTYTDARYKLGSIRTTDGPEAMPSGLSTDSHREWIFVYNDEASTAFAQGDVIIRDTLTAGGYDGILHAGASVVAAIRILGVAQFAIAAGSYGWVLKRGMGEVRAGTTGITADVAVVTEDANTTDIGKAKVWETQASGEEEKGVFAYATETAADAALATCYISCP